MITALIGPSGCGKTTLLRCFNRINERYGNVTTTGEITILGKNIYDPDVSLSELRKSVGMVFQRPNPLPISIYENVLFGVRVHTRRGDVQPQRAATRWSNRPCATCSSGTTSRTGCRRKATHLTLEQQQKLCIARLLPLKPRVILMDEPCSALDAEGIERIEDADRRAAREVHDRDRHAQHGPGPARQRRVHLHAPGPDRRARPDARHVPQSPRKGDGDVRHRPVRVEPGYRLYAWDEVAQVVMGRRNTLSVTQFRNANPWAS